METCYITDPKLDDPCAPTPTSAGATHFQSALHLHRLLVLVCVLLTACRPSKPTMAPPSMPKLEYEQDSQTLVISADRSGSPGGPRPGEMCNRIPGLRVWGDGRVVYAYFQPDRGRVVKTGYLDSAQIQSLLQILTEGGFFRTNTPEARNPAGTSYDIDVNLKSRGFNYSWNSEPVLYTDLMSAIQEIHLAEFSPEKALLVTDYFSMSSSHDNPLPEWPTQYGFSLAEADQGYWVTSEALAFLWQVVNDPRNLLDNHRVPGLRDGDKIYSFALEIPGVSLYEPPYNCWGSTKTILP